MRAPPEPDFLLDREHAEHRERRVDGQQIHQQGASYPIVKRFALGHAVAELRVVGVEGHVRAGAHQLFGLFFGRGADVDEEIRGGYRLGPLAGLGQMGRLHADDAGNVVRAHQHGFGRQHPVVDAAHLLEPEHAVAVDAGDHKPDFIHMGRDHRGAVPACPLLST